MTLSRKHFIAIAKILAERNTDEGLINDFCDYFKSENINFDYYTFKSYIEKIQNEKIATQI